MDYELARLRALRQQVSEMGDRLDSAIASLEAEAGEEEVQRRRRSFRIIAIPALIGAGIAAGRALFGNARRTAVTTGALTITATAAYAVTHLPPDRHHSPGALPRIPATASPAPNPTHHAKPRPYGPGAALVPLPVGRRRRPDGAVPSTSLPPLPLPGKTPPPVVVPTPPTPPPVGGACKLKIVPPKLKLTCRRLDR
jgi:hypothetical protein